MQMSNSVMHCIKRHFNYETARDQLHLKERANTSEGVLNWGTQVHKQPQCDLKIYSR